MNCPACRGEGIVSGPRACRRCHGVGLRARADEAAVVKACSCGLAYDARAWSELGLVGVQDDGEGGELELRNCTCGSTIAIVLEVAA